jgi:hypothetical protein
MRSIINNAATANLDKNTGSNNNKDDDPLFEQRIELITAGLDRQYSKRLFKLAIRENSQAIIDFLSCLKTEVNNSDHHKRSIIMVLTTLSKFCNKPFREMTREDIVLFLDSIRKPEASDPLHKWIGT